MLIKKAYHKARFGIEDFTDPSLLKIRLPQEGAVVTENPKGGIAENFGRSESHQKLFGGITSVKKHSKGGSAKFHLV